LKERPAEWTADRAKKYGVDLYTRSNYFRPIRLTMYWLSDAGVQGGLGSPVMTLQTPKKAIAPHVSIYHLARFNSEAGPPLAETGRLDRVRLEELLQLER
jgi:hypothetical protein